MRHTIDTTLICICICICVILASCASTPSGQAEYDTAIRLEQAGNMDDALPYINEALNKQPDSEQFLGAKARITQTIVARLTREASTLAQSDDLTIVSLSSANERLRAASQLLPDSSQVSEATRIIDSSSKQFFETVTTRRDTVKRLMNQQNWAEAYYEMSDLLHVYPEFEDVPQLQQRLQREGTAYYLGLARESLAREDVPSAREHLSMAARIHPQNAEVTRVAAEAERKNNLSYFTESARIEAESGNWEKVKQLCETARQYPGSDTYCEQGLRLANGRIHDSLMEVARQQLAQGHLLSVASTYGELTELPDSQARQDLDSLAAQIAKRIVSSADKLDGDGNSGTAWYLLKALEPIQVEHRRIQNVEDKINKRIRKSIAVFDFQSTSDSPDSGIIIANNLISDLFRNASKDVTILERENLKSILEELKLAQIGVVSENATKELGTIYGIDIAIMGSVLRYAVDSSESQSSKTVRVQIGEEIIDNIDYLNWQAMNPNAKQSDLRDAPQAKILAPKYENVRYEVQSAKKAGFIELSFRIIDVATGENIKVKTVEKKELVSDTSNEGVESANIPFDPMEIPTDTEMMKSIGQKVVDELMREVLTSIQSLERVYFEEAERHAKRQDLIASTEKFVDAVFDARMKSLHDSPVIEASLSRIELQLTDYPL